MSRRRRSRLRKLVPEDLVGALLVVAVIVIVFGVTWLGLSTIIGEGGDCQGLPCLD